MRRRKRTLELILVIALIATASPWLLDFMKLDSESAQPKEKGKVEGPTYKLAPPSGRLAAEGVWLGMTADQLLSQHGSPSRRDEHNQGYAQWDYFKNGRLSIVVDPDGKVVTVNGSNLMREGRTIVTPGTPLTAIETDLGKAIRPIDTLREGSTAGFSVGGQLVHVEHRNKKAQRVNLTVDYSVVAPPEPVVEPALPDPEPEPIILREPPMRQISPENPESR